MAITTAITAARFFSLLFTSLALAPGLAHALELPNKIHLSGNEYLTVQQLYRGWAFLGILVVGAFVSTATLAILVHDRPVEFMLAFIAFICIAATQVLFWSFTFPVNRQTNNWTVLPDNWMVPRAQWEYSHAASATLNFLAVIALFYSVSLGARAGGN